MLPVSFASFVTSSFFVGCLLTERHGRSQTGLFSSPTPAAIRAALQVESMSSTLFPRKLVERTVGDKLLSIETGHLAKQASGAVVVRIGDTMTLVAVVAGPRPRRAVTSFR